MSDINTRLAVIAILTESYEKSDSINSILHEYREYIIGRMGIPYRAKGVNIISIALDAPQDKINALAGKIGRIPGVAVKTLYSEK